MCVCQKYEWPWGFNTAKALFCFLGLLFGGDMPWQCDRLEAFATENNITYAVSQTHEYLSSKIIPPSHHQHTTLAILTATTIHSSASKTSLLPCYWQHTLTHALVVIFVIPVIVWGLQSLLFICVQASTDKRKLLKLNKSYEDCFQ